MNLLDYTNRLNIARPFFVEFGASTGGTTSPTSQLLESGWRGLWIECDDEKFDTLNKIYGDNRGITLLKEKVTPYNIVKILKREYKNDQCFFTIPQEFGCLCIDVDGYDYYVLEALLKSFRPAVILCEINEKIPPPIRFSVQYSDDWKWDKEHFYGMSLSKLYDLCVGFSYDLVDMENENAIIIAMEVNNGMFSVYTPETLYELKYVHSRLATSPESYNHNVRDWLYMDVVQCMDSIKNFFSHSYDKFQIHI
jgi:hypothetical protein